MRADRIRTVLQSLSQGLFEKEEILRLAVLATISGENVFLYGPTGVAKSMIARRLSWLFRDARSFEYLLGRFSTPDELFGPISITQLKDHDRYERIVDGFLPAAEIVFLDEIWNASSPILNTLLTAINERRFRNGKEELPLPLKTVIGAAGTLPPDDPALTNLWDRFLLRLETTEISTSEAFLQMLLDTGDGNPSHIDENLRITPDELDEWHDQIDLIRIPRDIQEFILDVRERISRNNRMRDDTSMPLQVSDRRWKQIANLLRTSAFLNDRQEVDALDCILMRHCLWSRREDVDTVNTIIEEALYRYSTSGRFDPEAVRNRLADTIATINAARYEILTEKVDVPLEYRGEYYRILDFVEDHLTLIWIGDYQSLNRDAPTATDLFFYGDSEEYAYSERLPVVLIDATTVEITGERFSIETARTEREKKRPITVSESTLQELQAQLAELRTETDQVMEAILRYRDNSTGEAAQHLFVHHSYADIIISGMNQAAQDFATLQLDIDRTIDELR